MNQTPITRGTRITPPGLTEESQDGDDDRGDGGQQESPVRRRERLLVVSHRGGRNRGQKEGCLVAHSSLLSARGVGIYLFIYCRL